MRNTLSSSNKELVDLLERKQLFFFEKNVFVTFGWICIPVFYLRILGLDGHRTGLILEFDQICNKWNYLHVGNNFYKQVEGISMGCYFVCSVGLHAVQFGSTWMKKFRGQPKFG